MDHHSHLHKSEAYIRVHHEALAALPWKLKDLKPKTSLSKYSKRRDISPYIENFHKLSDEQKNLVKGLADAQGADLNESGQVRLLLPHNSPHRASLIKSIQLKMSAQLEDFLLELPWEIKRDGYYVYSTNDRIMVRDLYLAPESLTPTENAIIDAALAIGDLKHMQRGHIAEANIINEEYASTIKQQEARHRARQKSAFSLQERDIPFPVISSEEPPRSPDPKIPQNAVTLTGKGALFTALCDKYNLSGEFGGRVNVRDHYDETYGKSYPKENQR